MKSKFLTILLLAASVAMVSLSIQGYYYERKISSIVNDYEAEESLMIVADSLGRKFYYISGEINATQDPIKLDSLSLVFKDVYDKLSPVTAKLATWGKNDK